MDLSLISTIQQQLSKCNIKQSLQIQNHIYGCFILMEDIAQKTYEVSDNVISGTNFTFNMDTQFSEIGIRFGFIMDTKLVCESFLPEYKTAWLKQLESVSQHCDLEEVDATEDSLIEMIQKEVPSSDSFFIHALDKGTLPQDWVGKVLDILFERDTKTLDTKTLDTKTDEPIESNDMNKTNDTNKTIEMKKQYTKRHVRFETHEGKKFNKTRRKPTTA